MDSLQGALDTVKDVPEANCEIDENLSDTSTSNPVESIEYLPIIKHAARLGIKALNKYYSLTDDSYIYRIAILLHPAMKADWMRDQGWETEWIEEAINILREIWDADYNPGKIVPSKPSFTATGSSTVAQKSKEVCIQVHAS